MNRGVRTAGVVVVHWAAVEDTVLKEEVSAAEHAKVGKATKAVKVVKAAIDDSKWGKLYGPCKLGPVVSVGEMEQAWKNV